MCQHLANVVSPLHNTPRELISILQTKQLRLREEAAHPDATASQSLVPDANSSSNSVARAQQEQHKGLTC